LPVPSPAPELSPDERALVAPFVSDLDAPVFALVGLPETLKGALFARYSRYAGTLRRLMVDEFAGDLPAHPPARDEGERSAALYERVFLGYGDDSVAQLGGAHVACEYASNVLTKLVQRPRLASYLEQSTRYIRYDRPMADGGFRYHRDPELGPEYAAAMDFLFAAYAEALERTTAWAGRTYAPAPGESPSAHRRAVRAKALDLVRGLLPAASLSHMGIYASGQAYEQLVLHLLAHPLPEARRYGRLILRAAQAVMPSFVARVERPDRGGVWVEHLARREAAGRRWARRFDLEADDDLHGGAGGPSVRLLDVDGDEDDLLAALLFESAGVSEERVRARLAGLGADERAAALADLLGHRENRRHRPGRGLERLRYRFEITADYGAFRDLQRHRLLTVQWQALTPDLGADVPEELALAGADDLYRRGLERSESTYRELAERGLGAAAAYAVCLGFRIRFVLDLNAREAMHLVELRSGREGHPSYRAVAHEMHRLIGQAHPAVAEAMTHVDLSTEPRLERMLSELRLEARQPAG